MEQQIHDMMRKAFWDKLDEDVEKNELKHTTILVNEIKDILKSFVPSRIDIHEKIDADICGEVSWETQKKLVNWIEKFQSPVHDKFTRNLKSELPIKLSDFLKKYYDHISLVHKEVFEYRQRIANGENVFKSKDVQSSGNNVPDNIKTGLS